MSRILSPLLSTRENGLLFNLLSHECSVLACGIVQLVMAAPPQKKEWKSHSFGVLCLVQDKTIQSTFMRLYCLNKKVKMQWEQELFTPFKYSEASPYFHTFPGDECQIGLNFADEDEAKQFYTAVQKQINENKASPALLVRRYSVGGISECKDKLDNIFRGCEVQKRLSLRSASRIPHPLASESKATVFSTMSGLICDLPQTLSGVNEESMSLAQRKGPLPPIPIHARAAMLKLNRSASMQTYETTFPVPARVPPPPSYHAPTAPDKAHSAGLNQTFHANDGVEDVYDDVYDGVYDDYL
ncbi:uncharacterized protein si:dkey-197j19.6 [Danio aesculapii]|uniref:uncharacterized protein si:dkey-197j19.6 n=1 Tax=Danio aesculapii TaxID=1142201 RepID=UPI0024C00B43|nr:uncharacterized protein si:dkey-197j19.6 [Danio aesculapii]